jgi:hypothetical protein
MEVATGANTQIPMENAIHPQTIVQMEPEIQICALVMAVVIAVSTSIQTIRVALNHLDLDQICVFTMAEGVVVSTLTMMGHASHLQWGVVMVQDSLGVVSNTGEVTDASMKTMMGRFAIVLHHQVLMVEIPLCVISMVVVTYVNILKTV